MIVFFFFRKKKKTSIGYAGKMECNVKEDNFGICGTHKQSSGNEGKLNVQERRKKKDFLKNQESFSAIILGQKSELRVEIDFVFLGVQNCDFFATFFQKK